MLYLYLQGNYGTLNTLWVFMDRKQIAGANMTKKTDVIIIGTGAAGLFCALHFPEQTKILMLTKEEVDKSDSFLAQGGICMLRGEEDYEGYFEDTMRAGHYENNPASVEVMIRSSQDVARELIAYGVDFERDGDGLAFTKEGGHGKPRILFHEDVTGREITSTLIENVQKRKNITILEHTSMLDIISKGNHCYGVVIQNADGAIETVQAKFTVLACGGLGGLYQHSTNFRHITGDAVAIAKCHNVALQHVDYIQIHPTTLYSEKPGRRFLISESVRGEGAILLNKNKERFCNELLPRDVVTAEIEKQMAKDKMPYVWLSMENIPTEEIKSHFPNILKQCLEEGYDPTKECIPVVPAQHYFMGGIRIDLSGKTSMEFLYAVGETACNGVHGKNRLASNSLLESMVFAKRAAFEIAEKLSDTGFGDIENLVDLGEYQDIDRRKNEYRRIVLKEIERERKNHE
jgi:L-aspartate oxidase